MVRRGLVLSLIFLVVAYGAVVLWFRYNEDDLIFAPDRGDVLPPDPGLELKAKDITIKSGELVLGARVISPPSSLPKEEAGWLLYFHGSSGNVGVSGYNEAWAQFRDLGLGVFAVDYRGFGRSQGQVSERGIYQDSRAAYDYLTRDMGVAPSRILLYGFSMGAAAAIELAMHVDAAGLMVEGAWLSIPALGKQRYPFLPVSLMAKNQFPSERLVGKIAMPKLFLHARGDAAIPIAHGRKLFDLAPQPKDFHAFSGEHGTAHLVDPAFFGVVRDFVRQRGLPIVSSGATHSHSSPR